MHCAPAATAGACAVTHANRPNEEAGRLIRRTLRHTSIATPQGRASLVKWAARIGRFAGIDLYIHATFPLLFVWFGFVYWAETGTIGGVLIGLALIASLFLCVVLHEYGHALTARRYGIGTRNITLLPIGGVALLEKMPQEPKQEIVVALMGPAVNVVIAAALFLVLSVTGGPGSLLELSLVPQSFLLNILYANIFLALFNMIPAFPMDGGRVLRAVLSLRTDRVRATRLAANVGQVLAIGFGVLGLFGNPFLILIAVFIWVGAGAEANAAEIESNLHRQPVRRAMITDFQTLAPDEPLARAIDLTLAGTQKDFPVVRGGAVIGMLTQGDILRGLRDRGAGGLVTEVMRPAATADISATLSHLLENLQQKDVRLICILRSGALVGLVDLENITEFLRIQAALRQQ
jgi:Zn-dependent protease/predicted transcriptional regulator